jgi:putative oxidoreductase
MQSRSAVVAWTLVRVTFGMMLVLAHGLPKVTGNMERFTAGVASLGFPMPTFFAWCAALTELVGGLLVAVGLLTRPMAAFAAFTMLVAAYSGLDEPFSGMEKSLLFLTVFVGLIITGPGPWSLDAKLRRKA